MKFVLPKSLLTYATAICVLFSGIATAQPIGDCSNEPDLSGRSDVLLCEPFESETWWSDHGFSLGGGLTTSNRPAVADQMTHTSIVSDECLSDSCMKVDTPRGVTNSLSVHWPLANVGMEPDELYFRYYMKVGADWTPNQCDAAGNHVFPSEGKLWGFADVRSSSDPGGQCGNGGATSDGLNCWSARGLFSECRDGWAANGFPYDNSCAETPNARLRIGNYLYVPDTRTSHGANGLWDAHADRSSLGDDFSSQCWRDDPNNPDPNCYCNSTNNMYCGIGSAAQLVPERWYAVETYIKLNTPGIADGVIRGWVNDVLAYEKTNVLFRMPGHDNLHIRTLWLNTYKGGINGNCEDSNIYYDQLVVAAERIGAFNAGPIPEPPTDLRTSR